MIADNLPLRDGVCLRPMALADATPLAEAYRRNREHLRPWEPVRPEAFFTYEGQLARLAGILADRDGGRVVPWMFTDDADPGRIIGGITLTNLVMGPFCSASLGYWLDGEETGRGLATAAVEAVCRVARDNLGLHRIEASTLLENAASQRVLAKCGFEQIGTAPRYLSINGAWRDHHLFQRVLY
ncbi:GNAT family protein [Streptomyces sp. NPDC050738]|uniref:GNAT family N-acetyltransferase n=1 Tax=Streptomyces sp. NPDC050738 TaxID=3154744 RepID=UPI003433F88F